MIAQDILSGINPVYWQFWIGLLLVIVVLFARDGILGGAGKLVMRGCSEKDHELRVAHRAAVEALGRIQGQQRVSITLPAARVTR